MDYRRFGLPAFRSLHRRDYILAVVSGILLALSFPKAGLSFLVWAAFVPLFLACGQKSAGKAAVLGFVAGLTGYAGILYWLNIVMTTYGKLPLPLSIFLYLLLVAYLAVYVAVVFYLARRAEEKGIPAVLSFPVFWVGLEYIRSFLLTGFPWASLGYTQYRVPVLIQVADLTGVYGISFLVALANVVIYLLLRKFVKKGGESELAVRGAIVLAVLLTAVLVYGEIRMREPETGHPLKISLIQGNIDQGIKWDPAFMEATVSIYDRLTRKAVREGTDLVIWPESATPFFFQEDSPQSLRVRELARELRVELLFGSPAYDDTGGIRRYFNSAFLVSSAGVPAGRSDKVHLVPFGEYVPLAHLLPFVSKLVEGVGDFSPGDSIRPLETAKGKVGVLVCFEGIFPEISRRYVAEGARVLVNVTNDAWYGRSSAPYQHLSMAVFRAVENRVPLVRAANTGITAIIDRNGVIGHRTGLFEESFLNGEVRAGSNGTFYTRFGDLFALLCLAASAVFFIAGFRKPATAPNVKSRNNR